jgi:hypothetical protein
VLSVVGLTAGEAFVVVFLAAFIITAQYWPKLGALLGEALVNRAERHRGSPEK